MLSVSAFNKSPSFWGPTAGEFDPDRWDDDKAHGGAVASNYGFLSFIQGPRNCIGKEFAFNEFVVLVAGLVGQFEFVEVEGEHMHKVVDGVTARPFGGMKAGVRVLEW